LKHPIAHGGNPDSIRSRLRLGDQPLVDFSSNLNPLGPSPRVLDAAKRGAERVGFFPEPGSPRLTARLAERHGVPADRVIVGAGVTELIGLVAQSLREVLVLHAEEVGDPRLPLSHLVEPTYGEYRRASVLNVIRTEIWSKHVIGWTQDFLPRSASGIFWTGHPNNPTGRAWDRDRLLELVDDTQGLLVVVDESFLPFLSDESARSLAQSVVGRPNLLVLRSLTRIHAMPGARVGYAISSEDMITRLKQFQNPWTISAGSEEAALAALRDEEDGRLEDVRALTAREAARLTDRLWDVSGLRPVWPSRDRPEGVAPPPPFVLVSVTDLNWTSPLLQDELARRGFFVRECSDFPGLEVGALLTGPDLLVASRGHLRISVRTPAENDALLACVKEVLNSESGQ
jgi:threonine-phosphate decarboxylase